MGSLMLAVVTDIRAFVVPRHKFAMEAAAMRQQLAVFKRKQARPRLSLADRLFWTTLRQLYSDWADALILVTGNGGVLASRWLPSVLARCGLANLGVPR